MKLVTALRTILIEIQLINKTVSSFRINWTISAKFRKMLFLKYLEMLRIFFFHIDNILLFFFCFLFLPVFSYASYRLTSYMGFVSSYSNYTNLCGLSISTLDYFSTNLYFRSYMFIWCFWIWCFSNISPSTVSSSFYWALIKIDLIRILVFFLRLLFLQIVSFKHNTIRFTF